MQTITSVAHLRTGDIVALSRTISPAGYMTVERLNEDGSVTLDNGWTTRPISERTPLYRVRERGTL